MCGDFLGIHKSTASRAIKLVSRTLATLRPEYINFPETIEERNGVVQGFYNIARFPRVIGAIDCTHIKIRSPGGHDAEIYRNRKRFFSLNVQTICDSGLRIQSIVCRWPGSAHDSTIFRHSAVKTRFETDEFGDLLLVGDAGYPISNYLLTPLHNPTNHAERRYNAAQIATRNPVERSYGVWKRRFPILSVGINIKVTTAVSVVLATAVLHNIALVFGEQIPRVTLEEERLVELTAFPAVPLPPETAIAGEQPERRRLTQTQACRNRLIRYFSTL